MRPVGTSQPADFNLSKHSGEDIVARDRGRHIPRWSVGVCGEFFSGE